MFSQRNLILRWASAAHNIFFLSCRSGFLGPAKAFVTTSEGWSPTPLLTQFLFESSTECSVASTNPFLLTRIVTRLPDLLRDEFNRFGDVLHRLRGVECCSHFATDSGRQMSNRRRKLEVLVSGVKGPSSNTVREGVYEDL